MKKAVIQNLLDLAMREAAVDASEALQSYGIVIENVLNESAAESSKALEMLQSMDWSVIEIDMKTQQRLNAPEGKNKDDDSEN